MRYRIELLCESMQGDAYVVQLLSVLNVTLPHRSCLIE